MIVHAPVRVLHDIGGFLLEATDFVPMVSQAVVYLAKAQLALGEVLDPLPVEGSRPNHRLYLHAVHVDLGEQSDAVLHAGRVACPGGRARHSPRLGAESQHGALPPGVGHLHHP